ncbi:hypothetical protein [Helicobacter cappadocius]|uniref:indole-3-glycerol-phosphate synthase n=1 Tax=Helicobacter cappadocius TaxID=3063998 RepID=A0AA90PX23_9HELI|nr:MULTISPECIES: hypothetical protein [unclassified Helicobacter]MDO7252306.1 hypothetical protein [Helicobacter sp. faydin-H75]MDP2538173.1 hypothetical protein [Helicobacter sp. faydin-H76]
MQYSQKSFENLKKSLKNREEFLPFDFLGRSLSYNPYMPRALIEDFKRDGKIAKKCFALPAFGYDNLAFAASLNSEVIRVDFSSLYEDNILGADAFDCLTQLRRYSEKIIIHNDIFLNQYQVLESCIYGSDCVVFDAGILAKELSKMCEFATRLGLVPIVKISSLRDIKMAIFARAQILYIAQDFSNLIASIPNSKIVLCDLSAEVSELDEKNSYGVDMFFVSV